MNMELRRIAVVAVLGLALASVVAKDADAAASPQAVPRMGCAAPAYHALDFWVGDWDVYELNHTDKVAQVRVERELDGCVLHEYYEDAASLKGESFSIYDASRKRWHQTWVTNTGTLLTIEGGVHGKSVVMGGTEHVARGPARLVRGTWQPIRGGVRESAVLSLDHGKTWKPWFDLVFRPHVL